MPRGAVEDGRVVEQLPDALEVHCLRGRQDQAGPPPVKGKRLAGRGVIQEPIIAEGPEDARRLRLAEGQPFVSHDDGAVGYDERPGFHRGDHARADPAQVERGIMRGPLVQVPRVPRPVHPIQQIVADPVRFNDPTVKRIGDAVGLGEGQRPRPLP